MESVFYVHIWWYISKNWVQWEWYHSPYVYNCINSVSLTVCRQCLTIDWLLLVLSWKYIMEVYYFHGFIIYLSFNFFFTSHLFFNPLTVYSSATFKALQDRSDICAFRIFFYQYQRIFLPIDGVWKGKSSLKSLQIQIFEL